MNKKALKMLLTRLEHIDEDLWDMSKSEGPCGCFIEHTCQVLDIDNSQKSFVYLRTRSEVCKAALGLRSPAWEELCMPKQDLAWWACKFPLDPDFVSLDRAIKVLRNFIETGEVDWRIR